MDVLKDLAERRKQHKVQEPLVRGEGSIRREQRGETQSIAGHAPSLARVSGYVRAKCKK